MSMRHFSRAASRHTNMITRRLSRPGALSKSSPWTCPACASARSPPQWVNQTAFSPFCQPSQRRGIRHHPQLSYEESFKAHGVPGLLSRKGYELAWTEYQKSMVEKVNQLTAGDVWEDTSVKDLALQFARDPMNASLFNYSSMAFNNHFFFSTLSVAPAPLTKCPNLQESLVNTFGSIETLQATMLDQAAGMFGPGFVWLVWARDVDSSSRFGGAGGSAGARSGKWRLLNTYLAGTPFPEAGYRQQSIDVATSNAGSYNSYLIEQPAYLAQKHQEQRERDAVARAQQEQEERDTPTSQFARKQPVNTVGAFGRFSQQGRDLARLPPGGTNLMPVLCVNTWEHVWLYDYGINGKRNFLKDWWAAVDWGAVEQNAPLEAKERRATFQTF